MVVDLLRCMRHLKLFRSRREPLPKSSKTRMSVFSAVLEPTAADRAAARMKIKDRHASNRQIVQRAADEHAAKRRAWRKLSEAATTVQSIWRGHKLRSFLYHEGDFDLQAIDSAELLTTAAGSNPANSAKHMERQKLWQMYGLPDRDVQHDEATRATKAHAYVPEATPTEKSRHRRPKSHPRVRAARDPWNEDEVHIRQTAQQHREDHRPPERREAAQHASDRLASDERLHERQARNMGDVPTAPAAMTDHLFGGKLSARDVALVGPVSLETRSNGSKYGSDNGSDNGSKYGSDAPSRRLQYLVLRVEPVELLEPDTPPHHPRSVGGGAALGVGPQPELPSMHSFKLLEIKDWPPTADEIRRYGVCSLRQGQGTAGMAEAGSSATAPSAAKRSQCERPRSAATAASASACNCSPQRVATAASASTSRDAQRSAWPARSASTAALPASSPASGSSRAHTRSSSSRPSVLPSASQLALRSYVAAISPASSSQADGWLVGPAPGLRVSRGPPGQPGWLEGPGGDHRGTAHPATDVRSSLGSSIAGGGSRAPPWKGAITGGTQCTLLKTIRRQQDGLFFQTPRPQTTQESRKVVAAAAAAAAATSARPIFHSPNKTTCAYSGKLSCWNMV